MNLRDPINAAIYNVAMHPLSHDMGGFLKKCYFFWPNLQFFGGITETIHRAESHYAMVTSLDGTLA